MPDAWRLLLALAAFVPSLRLLPQPRPISPAAMTAGILLASAPIPGDATFRAKAVLLVIALILRLTLLLEQVTPVPQPSGQARKED